MAMVCPRRAKLVNSKSWAPGRRPPCSGLAGVGCLGVGGHLGGFLARGRGPAGVSSTFAAAFQPPQGSRRRGVAFAKLSAHPVCLFLLAVYRGRESLARCSAPGGALAQRRKRGTAFAVRVSGVSFTGTVRGRVRRIEELPHAGDCGLDGRDGVGDVLENAGRI